jgi:hypothetical protein
VPDVEFDEAFRVPASIRVSMSSRNPTGPVCREITTLLVPATTSTHAKPLRISPDGSAATRM